MKVCIVHNEYGVFSGEEAVVRNQTRLLEEHGHEVSCFLRSSAEIPDMWLGNLRAFFSGIYSYSSRRRFRDFLKDQKPDVVHVHNLFPLISPSVLSVPSEFGIPVVMTVHNYRLVCPNGLHYTDGEVCTRCIGGKEYWCFLSNCESSLLKSLGYALRGWWSRIRGYYGKSVDRFLCLTDFQRSQLIDAGFSAEKVHVLPNPVDVVNVIAETTSHVAFVGRVSQEKGIATLLSAAKKVPHVPIQIAGDTSAMRDVEAGAPSNVTFLGHCSAEQLEQVYRSARFVVVPSIWYEGFPNVVLEAMVRGKAIVASNIGGLSEIVVAGVTGELAAPGDEEGLAKAIGKLWDDTAKAEDMGRASRKAAVELYAQEKHYGTLVDTYREVLA